jgi:hypothetical protein
VASRDAYSLVMIGELGRDWSLPLFPAGAAMFDALPFAALVLDALAPAVGNGVITLRDGAGEGALVIRDGLVSETVWVGDDVRSIGDAALTLIRAAHSATVSARRLSDEAMGLVGPLIRGAPCYADLRLEWVVWPQLLQDLRERGKTYVVELTTPTGRGVTIIQDERQIATFADSHPALGNPDLLDDMASGGVGSIRILVDSIVSSALQPRPRVTAVPSSDPQRREVAAQQTVRPLVVQADDPNATLSALFGPHRDGPDQYQQSRPDRLNQRRQTQVESVLPQLKSLVHNRLQRSSPSVEEVVESAAHDRHSVQWLADRVRVMTMRGFLPSTFDQLADDMLALAARESD